MAAGNAAVGDGGDDDATAGLTQTELRLRIKNEYK